MDTTDLMSLAKRSSPGLMVNTSLPPSKPVCTKPVVSPRFGSPASSVATTTSSIGSSKRSSPRCSSPTCALDRIATTTAPVLPHPISTALYFRLLKKSHVLDQLLHVHAHLESQQQELRRLEADRARADSIQTFVFQELETYKRKFVEAQQFLLELLEAMTALTIQEDELQRGIGTVEAQSLAQTTKEDIVVRDLEAQVKAMQTKTPTTAAENTTIENDQSLESRALRAVGLCRIEQLAGICAAYESQLKKSEAELSQAMHAAYKDECLAKLKQYETRQQQHDNELKSLYARIDNLTSQTRELQDVIDDQRNELVVLREINDDYQHRYVTQTEAIEKFGAELKAELRKRYGVVPNVVDSRWHAFFPTCSTPE